MKINDLAPSKKTKLVIFIVRSDDKCLTLTASVTRFNLDNTDGTVSIRQPPGQTMHS
jgi:hypothetical protein